MNEDRLLRLPEVSARLALSKSAIYQMIRRGELIPVRIGGAVRFPASAVDQLIRNEPLQEAAMLNPPEPDKSSWYRFFSEIRRLAAELDQIEDENTQGGQKAK